MELSPLHAAVEADDLSRVQALVVAGADIEEKQNLRDSEGDDHHDGNVPCLGGSSSDLFAGFEAEEDL